MIKNQVKDSGWANKTVASVHYNLLKDIFNSRAG